MESENVHFITPGMGREIGAALVKAVPDEVPFEVGKLWIGDQGMVNIRVRDMLIPPEKITVSTGADFAEKLMAQENFWRRLFPTLDFGFDPDQMLVWPRPQGHDRLLVTPRGLWGNRLYEKCAEKFPCWRYSDNLDNMIHLSGSPYVTTARWFRDRQEADEELGGKSAQVLEKLLIPGIILPERELYELVYLEETGQHLDQKNTTLISGSRVPGGCVPDANWRGGKFRVRCYGADDHDSGLRSRSAG